MTRALLLVLLLLTFVAPVAAQTATPTIYTCNLPPPPTATPEPTYSDILLGLNPIAYWKLDETAGGTAADSSGNGHSGSYSGVTLNGATWVDGSPAPSFDGVNDFVNIYSAGLNSAYTANEVTWFAWIQVNSVGNWTDTTINKVIKFATANGDGAIDTTGFSNTLRFTRSTYPGGSLQTFNYTGTGAPTTFVPVALTQSLSANELKGYLSGSQVGATQTGLTSWGGSLLSTQTLIGASATSGAQPWHGSIAHVAVFDYALSASQIALISSVPTPVTPTPEPECIPVREINQFWTVEVGDLSGTPQPGQPVMFAYTMTAGQAANAVLNGALLFSLWIAFLLWMVLRQQRKKPSAVDRKPEERKS